MDRQKRNIIWHKPPFTNHNKHDDNKIYWHALVFIHAVLETKYIRKHLKHRDILVAEVGNDMHTPVSDFWQCHLTVSHKSNIQYGGFALGSTDFLKRSKWIHFDSVLKGVTKRHLTLRHSERRISSPRRIKVHDS